MSARGGFPGKPTDVVTHDDLEQRYRVADKRLRALLFGDGMDSPGFVKGDERRNQIASALRRMREAFDATMERAEQAREAEARAADLEAELHAIARSRTRNAPKAGESGGVSKDSRSVGGD